MQEVYGIIIFFRGLLIIILSELRLLIKDKIFAVRTCHFFFNAFEKCKFEKNKIEREKQLCFRQKTF